MLKVVIDTSVYIAAFRSPTSTSSSRQVINLWRQNYFTLVMSPQLLRELVAKLIQLEISEASIESLLLEIRSIALYIPGAYESTRLDNIDPDDNKFLAAAYEVKADYLVSLDNHLLNLKYYHGTQILTPALFLRSLLT